MNKTDISTSHRLFAVSLFILWCGTWSARLPAGTPSTGTSVSSSTTVSASDVLQLSFTECDALSEVEVRRLLHLEIHTIITQHKNRVRPIKIRIHCMPDKCTIIANDADRHQIVKRDISLATTDIDARERVVAIAATELVLSIWEISLSTPPKENPLQNISPSPENDNSRPDVSPIGGPIGSPVNQPATQKSSSLTKPKKIQTTSTTASPATPRTDGHPRQFTPKRRFSREKSLEIGAMWQMYPKTTTHFFGGEVGGSIQLRGPLHLHTALTPLGGLEHRSIGRVSLFYLSAVMGLEIKHPLFRLPVNTTLLFGFRGGYGRLAGRAESDYSQGHTLQGGVGGPLLRFSLLSARLNAVGVTLEMGYTLFGISGRVNDVLSISMRGVWLAVGIIFNHTPSPTR